MGASSLHVRPHPHSPPPPQKIYSILSVFLQSVVIFLFHLSKDRSKTVLAFLSTCWRPQYAVEVAGSTGDMSGLRNCARDLQTDPIERAKPEHAHAHANPIFCMEIPSHQYTMIYILKPKCFTTSSVSRVNPPGKSFRSARFACLSCLTAF